MTQKPENKIIWPKVEEREQTEFINNLVSLKNGGLITPQKGNDMLPEEYHETLPVVDIGNNVQLDKKNIDNPTDPTKSTDVIKGQRVNKTDVVNPLDNKGKRPENQVGALKVK